MVIDNHFLFVEMESGQSSGSCGHKRSALDTHPTCIKCTLCSPLDTCAICATWTNDVWTRVQGRRSHRSRKGKRSANLRLQSTKAVSPSGSETSEVSTVTAKDNLEGQVLSASPSNGCGVQSSPVPGPEFDAPSGVSSGLNPNLNNPVVESVLRPSVGGFIS